MTTQNNAKKSLCKRLIAVLLVICMVSALMVPLTFVTASADAAAAVPCAVTKASPLNVTAANGTNYSLFNSGRTGSGYSTGASSQVNNSYNNNGYDLY